MIIVKLPDSADKTLLEQWKLRYSYYMWQRSDMPWNWCYESAICAIENDPDNIYTDGPVYYAQEEMANWSD